MGYINFHAKVVGNDFRVAFAKVELAEQKHLNLTFEYNREKMNIFVKQCIGVPYVKCQRLQFPLFDENDYFDELYEIDYFVGLNKSVLTTILLFVRDAAKELGLPDFQQGQLEANLRLIESLHRDDFALKQLEQHKKAAWSIRGFRSDDDQSLKSTIRTDTQLLLIKNSRLDNDPEFPVHSTAMDMAFCARRIETLVHELERRKNLPPQDGNGDSAGCPTGLPFKEVGVSSM